MKPVAQLLVSATFTLITLPVFSATPEETIEAPDFPEALVAEGAEYFIANCGFCHGRDAQGGSRGLDLTRSDMTAIDVEGSAIGSVVRAGRVDKGMPAFPAISEPELAAVSAFIHTRRYIADTAEGGRRSVEPEDLATGDADRGARYFETSCASCHSPDGDLAGIASRLQGLELLMRMLNPASGRGGADAAKPILAVTTPQGERFAGELQYRDEFSVAMRDVSGVYRSWLTRDVDFTVDDPLQGHIDQLARYRDEDMHDVYAFLLTLE